MVLSVVAVVLAMCGTTYAGVQFGRNSVGTSQLRDGSVTRAKLRGSAVRCPANTVAIGPGCVETTTRAPEGYRAAVATCAALDRRLPFITELIALHARGHRLGNPELVADFNFNQPRYSQNVLFANAVTVGTDVSGTLRHFRCVAAPG